jgi:hypothetical protein
MQKLKINVFGELFSKKKVVLNAMEQEYYELIAARIKQPLHRALLDPFFYYHLRLNAVDSVEKLPSETVSGLLDTAKNQIEIWLDGRKIYKLKLAELNQDQYLIPLYNTKISILNNQKEKGIYIEEKEIGFIGSYEFITERFDIENLEFKLIVVDNQLLLQSINYYNSNTIFKKKETLITYRNSYEF